MHMTDPPLCCIYCFFSVSIGSSCGSGCALEDCFYSIIEQSESLFFINLLRVGCWRFPF